MCYNEVMANANVSDGFGKVSKIAGLVILGRALIFFTVQIPLMYGYAEAGIIDRYVPALIFSYLYFAYAGILGLKLGGAYLGSNRESFLSKLQSYNPPRKDMIPGKTPEKPKPRTTFPTAAPLKPRGVAIFLVADLLLAIALELTITDLPRLYIVILFEFCAMVYAIIESARN